MNIAIINGPNLNMLGQRDAKQYGSQTLDDIQKKIAAAFPECQFTFRQSNIEGKLVEMIQSLLASDASGLIGNWGGFTHTSVAIHDALELLDIPVIEVHISNIHGREPFRERSITGTVASGIITGFGAKSYLLGVYAVQMLSKDNS